MSGTVTKGEGFGPSQSAAPARARIETAAQMALEALAQDAEAVRSARVTADALLHDSEITDEAAIILQRGLDREADAILGEAADIAADDVAGLRCKGRVGAALLGAALRRDEDLSEAGGRFLLALLAEMTGGAG